MRCEECGTPRAGAGRYCVGCGMPLPEVSLDKPSAPAVVERPAAPPAPPPPGAPPWEPLAPPAPPPGRPRPRGLIISVLGGLVALLGLALVWALALHGHGSAQAGPAPSSSTSAPEPAPTPTVTPSAAATAAPTPTPTPPAPTQDPAVAAAAALQQQRAADLAQTPLRGQIVAQLASKNDGISDPLQTAADGSHVFHLPDILAEVDRLKAEPLGTRVFLLLSTDYGDGHLHNGQPLWVTFADGGFSSDDEVLQWCHRRFPTLSPDVFADSCTPRVLLPRS